MNGKNTDYTEENIVDIVITITGDAAVVINDDMVTDNNEQPSKNIVRLHLEHEGDVLVTINGEDFMVGEPD